MEQNQVQIKRHRMDVEENRYSVHQGHPALRIPEILEKILMSCDLHSIKSCRVVSQLWRDSSLKSWRTSAVVIFQDVDRQLNESNQLCQRKSISQFLKFLELSRSNDTKQLYTKFVLWGIKLSDSSTLRAFWRTCGPQIKSLELSYCTFESSNSLREVLFTYCPNMKEFCIGRCKVLSAEEQKPVKVLPNINLKSLRIWHRKPTQFAITWLELFAGLPSLQFLELPYYGYNHTMQEVFDAINALRRDNPSILKLQHITSTMKSKHEEDNIPVALYNYLTCPDIPVTNLSLGVHGDNAAAELNNILSSIGATLKILNLRRGSSMLDPTKCFPAAIKNQAEKYLINLQELCMVSTVFTNMTFLKFMPKLRKLCVFSEGSSGTATQLVTVTNCQQMKNFQLDSCLDLRLDHFVDAQVLRQLINWLPNIEKLRIELNNETFALVCQHWSNMISMDITWSGLDEFGFTGHDLEYVLMINITKGICSSSTVRQANISCLRNLQSLTMRNGGSRQILLGYCAVMLGIRQLQRLKYLELVGILLDQKKWLRSFRRYRPVNSLSTYHKVFIRSWT